MERDSIKLFTEIKVKLNDHNRTENYGDNKGHLIKRNKVILTL